MKKRGSRKSFQPNTDAVLSYCRNRAAPAGSSRHYASLYLSDWQRNGLFALYALDNALFSIPFLVSDPTVAKAKLQWWHHAIENLWDAEHRDHPILRGLLPYLKTPGWEPALFTTYIDQTQHWLDFDVFQTQLDYLQHIHNTSGQIGQLALLLCTAPDRQVSQFAKHFATVMDTVHFINTLDSYTQCHKLPFSLALLEQLGIRTDELLALDSPPSLMKLIDHQIRFVEKHLQAAQTLYDPNIYPNLRYFRVMMQLAYTTLQHYRKNLLKTGKIQKNYALLPIVKYWVALRTR